MTANEVWQFRTAADGKVTLDGRAAIKDHNALSTTRVVVHQEHVLVVRLPDAFAEKCRTCEVIGLVKSQTCSFINEYNDKVSPL